MAVKLPISFKEKATGAKSADGTGYPSRISASDLDSNFAYCAIDAGENWFEDASVGIFTGRKLKLPDVPPSGTYVLGVVDGVVQWIETEECE